IANLLRRFCLTGINSRAGGLVFKFSLFEAERGGGAKCKTCPLHFSTSSIWTADPLLPSLPAVVVRGASDGPLHARIGAGFRFVLYDITERELISGGQIGIRLQFPCDRFTPNFGTYEFDGSSSIVYQDDIYSLLRHANVWE